LPRYCGAGQKRASRISFLFFKEKL
jgi:hypothetical protein